MLVSAGASTTIVDEMALEWHTAIHRIGIDGLFGRVSGWADRHVRSPRARGECAMLDIWTVDFRLTGGCEGQWVCGGACLAECWLVFSCGLGCLVFPFRSSLVCSSVGPVSCPDPLSCFF